jgi:hypothetical protein
MRRIAMQACFTIGPSMIPRFADGSIAAFFAHKTAHMFNTTARPL